ncbi:MAG: ABC transporter permease [Myxococcales bacterium]|nr:ABC transporter permease [Myxococcales bacterium]
MDLLLTMALRNLGRNRRRTALTALTVALGTALLTVALSMLNGVLLPTLQKAAGQAGHVRVVDAEYARREQLMPLSENLADTAPIVAALAADPDVLAAFPHIAMGVTGCLESEEIGEKFALLHGAPTAYYTDVLHLDSSLAAGTMPTADDQVLLGRAFAEDIGAGVGSTVILLGQTQDGSPAPARLKVVGLVDLGSRTQNRQLWVSMEKARWMADLEGGATEVLAQVRDYRAADVVAARLRSQQALSGYDVHAWDERSPFDQIGGLLVTIKSVVAGIIVFITGLGVLNTMLMSVLERTGEIGVMRAFGLRRFDTVLLFFFEAIAIAGLGGLGGVALGAAGATILGRVGIHLGEGASKMPATIPINETMYPQLTADVLVTGFLLGLLMAVVGALLPSIRAARIQPVDAMRHRR